MKPSLRTVFLFLLVCQTAFADTLVMKSGDNKKGKILEETDTKILFQSKAEGLVVEVPKSDISIIDRDESLKQKGFVQLFSSPPPKKKKKRNWLDPEIPGASEKNISPTKKASASEEESFDPESAFQSVQKTLLDWLQTHPEAKKFIREWMKKFNGKSDEMDKLMRAAKEA